MNWIQHTQDLQAGKTVRFRPRGNSMMPIIESGQLVTVSPDTLTVAVGDVVFCKVNGTFYVHLVKAIDGDRFQIGNNRGRINGWTKQVFGKVIAVED